MELIKGNLKGQNTQILEQGSNDFINCQGCYNMHFQPSSQQADVYALATHS